MVRRYAVLWFPRLAPDRMTLRQRSLQGRPFVLAAAVHGRMVVQSVSNAAAAAGINPDMVVADARAMLPELLVFPYNIAATEKLLQALAIWCIRYTPVVATDPPNGLILDISGCAHLWGGEQPYLAHMITRFRHRGYTVRAAIADTIGAAWGVAHYGQTDMIVDAGRQAETLSPLPPTALRLPNDMLQRILKLGFRTIGQLNQIPATNLRRRFGTKLLTRLQQAIGTEREYINPVQLEAPYQERLPCPEPIRTAKGIEIAVERLLLALCKRLQRENKGLRKALLTCYRIDGHTESIEIGTGTASSNPEHLFRLFELKIPTIYPDLGIELFVLAAPLTEDVNNIQESLWQGDTDHAALAELLDNITNKAGADVIRRYLPQERYWPERSVQKADSLTAQTKTLWRTDKPRPLLLLPDPEPIEVMVPLPDYPPAMFRHRGQIHQIRKADGPERVEREWWIESGQPRDYYYVEDDQGGRYWLFRLGLYTDGEPKWFLHGLFA